MYVGYQQSRQRSTRRDREAVNKVFKSNFVNLKNLNNEKIKAMSYKKTVSGILQFGCRILFANIAVDTNKTIFGVQWQKIKQSFDRYCQ